jgi:hypothetical protein
LQRGESCGSIWCFRMVRNVSVLIQRLIVSLTAVIYCRLAFAVTFVLAVMPFVRNRGGISTRSDPKMNMSEGV